MSKVYKIREITSGKFFTGKISENVLQVLTKNIKTSDDNSKFLTKKGRMFLDKRGPNMFMKGVPTPFVGKFEVVTFKLVEQIKKKISP